MCCQVSQCEKLSSEWLFLHLLKDGDDLLKGGPLARVLIHADPDELGHVGAHTGADVQPQPLSGYPHAGLHGGEVREGHLPHGQLPQHHRVAPHVRRAAVDF